MLRLRGRVVVERVKETKPSHFWSVATGECAHPHRDPAALMAFIHGPMFLVRAGHCLE